MEGDADNAKHKNNSSSGGGGGNSNGNKSTDGLPLKATVSGKIVIDPQNIIYTSPQLGIVAFGDPSKVSIKDRTGRPLHRKPSSATVVHHRQQHQQVLGKDQEQPLGQELVLDEEDLSGDDGDAREAEDLGELLEQFSTYTRAPICWETTRLPDKSDLCHVVCNRLMNLVHPDCVVTVAGHQFSCHLVVLQSYSSYFDERSGHEFHLPREQVSPENFTLIYSWMISGTSSCRKVFSRYNVISLYLSAQFLGVPELEEQCWAFLTDQKLFAEETALALCLQAYAMRIHEVVQLMVPRVVHCFLPLVGSPSFSKMPLGVLTLLLRSNFIAINCEYEVFMAAVKWLMSDWPGRMKHTLAVMSCVRFGLMLPWQLVDVRRNPQNPEFLLVSADPKVADMMDRGMAYSVNRSHFAGSSSSAATGGGCGGGGGSADNGSWLERLELEEPEPRNWLGDGCKNYDSYQQFLRAVALSS